jgi:hypothetical protein
MAWVAKTFQPQSLALGIRTARADPENGERSIVESFLPEMDGNELQVNAFCRIDAFLHATSSLVTDVVPLCPKPAPYSKRPRQS